MLEYFNMEILPHYHHINKMLGIFKPEIKYEEEDWIIPVTVTLPSGSRQIIEDGIIVSCTHADPDFTPACCSSPDSDTGYYSCGCGGMDSNYCNDCKEEIENE